MKNLISRKPIKLYFIVGLLVLTPYLGKGYIQTVDMAWGPKTHTILHSNNTWILFICLNLMSKFLTSILLQKLILLTIFLLAGLGAHRLAALSKTLAKNPKSAYVAGLLYMANPIIYSRLMQGQWLVLLGYALLPWAVAAIWHLMQIPHQKNALRTFILTFLVAVTSLHTIGFVALAAVVLFTASTIRNKEAVKRRVLWSGAVVLVWILANSLWLVPALTGHSHIVREVGSFGPSQLQAFATSPTVHGSVPLSALLLEGFWPDLQFRYTLPSTLPTWWPAVVGIGILVIAGTVAVVRRRDRLGISLLILGVIAWWLGLGIAWGPSAGTTQWLIGHVPFYQGYREPQKWLMLLALCYAYLAAVGTGYLIEMVPKLVARLRHRSEPSAETIEKSEWRPVAIGLAALLPVLLVPCLFWGAGGQLHAADYPADWYAVRKVLDQNDGNAPVLVLPWHMYLRLSFTGRVVANPASHFFDQPVVTGTNPELIGVPDEASTPLEKYVGTTVKTSGADHDMASRLHGYGVRYVVLYKESDWPEYGWLAAQPGLHKVYDSPTIRLYQVSRTGQ